MKKFYVAVIRNKKAYLLKIYEDPQKFPKGHGTDTYEDIVNNILNNSLTVYNYSIDRGGQSNNKAIVLECNDTLAETKHLKDLLPIAKTISSGIKSYGLKVSKIKEASLKQINKLL